jgi:hypothetical protein
VADHRSVEVGHEQFGRGVVRSGCLTIALPSRCAAAAISNPTMRAYRIGRLNVYVLGVAESGFEGVVGFT